MHVLIVVYALATAASGTGNRYGVAKQDFSTKATCEVAQRVIKAEAPAARTSCVPK
jgi:hypothetical protein